MNERFGQKLNKRRGGGLNWVRIPRRERPWIANPFRRMLLTHIWRARLTRVPT